MDSGCPRCVFLRRSPQLDPFPAFGWGAGAGAIGLPGRTGERGREEEGGDGGQVPMVDRRNRFARGIEWALHNVGHVWVRGGGGGEEGEEEGKRGKALMAYVLAKEYCNRNVTIT